MRRDVYEEHGPGNMVISHEFGHQAYWLGNEEYQPCRQCGELALERSLDDDGLCPECLEKEEREND